MRAVLSSLLALALCAAHAQQGGWTKVGAILGPTASVQKDGSLKMERPRSDLQVQDSAGMLLSPEMGLLSRVVFKGTESQAQLTGEICLVREEFDDVMDALRQGGVDVGALGSRLAGEQPAVYFLKFAATGDGERLAGAVKRALAELAEERPISEGLRRTGQTPVVDWRSVSVALGQPVEQVGASRVWRAAYDDGSWITFGGCPCGTTKLLGNLQVSASQLQTAIDRIRLRKLSITAITRFGDKIEVAIEGSGDALRMASSVRSVLGGS